MGLPWLPLVYLLVKLGDGVHIFTDIDDTIKAAGVRGSIFSSGADRRFHFDEIYPGVCSLFVLLARHSSDLSSCSTGLASLQPARCDCPHYVTFLSARPRTLPFLQLRATSPIIAALSRAAKALGFATCPWPMRWNSAELHVSGLYGFVRDWLSNEWIAHQKHTNMAEQYMRMETQQLRIFFGDDGQGDHVAGLRMLKDNLVDFVFIHNVIWDSDNVSSVPYERSPEHPSFFFFETYLGAALLAFRLQLLDWHDVVAVAALMVADPIIEARFHLRERAHPCPDSDSLHPTLCFHPHLPYTTDSWLFARQHHFDRARLQLERDFAAFYHAWGLEAAWPPTASRALATRRS
eukprot:m.33682 g.33682  ORF g.33682 m.33682 type:complete len:349 (+) comp9485_c0_seq1:96-1142(+)